MTASPGGQPVPDDPEDRDPGLARERTSLAWTRTAISFAALGAAMLRVSLTGLLVLAAAGAIWGVGRLSAPPGPAARGHRWHLPRHLVPPTVTAATLLTALLALVLAALV